MGWLETWTRFKRKFSPKGRFVTVTLPVIGAVIAVISLAMNFLQYKAGWDIAEQSGAFEKANVTLGLKQIRLKPDERVAIVFGAASVKPRVPTIGSLPFTLVDEGQKSIDGVNLSIRFPKFAGRHDLAAMTSSISGPAGIAEIQNTQASDTAFDYSTYKVTRLDPKVAVSVDEPFYAAPTVLDLKTDVRTKDGKDLTVETHTVFSFDLLATVVGRDVAATNYSFDVTIIPASSLEDLGKLALREVVLPKRADYRHQAGFWTYLSQLLFKRETLRTFLVYQGMNENKIDTARSLFSPRRQADVGFIDYDILDWGLLFR